MKEIELAESEKRLWNLLMEINKLTSLVFGEILQLIGIFFEGL